MTAPRHPAIRGTSLVELSAASAVLAALVLMMFEIFDASAGAWGRAQRRAGAFRGARLAAGLMARDLASVCRSPLSTNLIIGAAGPDGCRVFVLTVPPGGRGEVAAVGYHCAWKADRHAYALARTFLPPAQTIERLRRGEDPFNPGGDPAPSVEELAPCLWDLRVAAFDAGGRALGEGPAFTTNLPARIEIAFRTLPREALPSIAARRPARGAWLGSSPQQELGAAATEAVDIRTSVALP